MKPDQALLKQLMHYDPVTGVAVWLKRPASLFTDNRLFSAETVARQWNARFAGQPIGAVNPVGHLEAKVFGRVYKLHTLIWVFMTGEWPKLKINHANDCLSDNRWSNLREATFAQIGARRKTTTKSGMSLRGAYATHRNGNAKPWKSSITVGGKRIHLGVYDTELEAHEAYKAAAEHFYGVFARSA